MTRRLTPILVLLRLLGAAVILTAAAYLLSWRILWNGPAGSDLPYHLDLVSWVSTSFPAMHWWYPWDAAGTSFRLGYPLAAAWLTVALSRLLHLGLSDAMQVFEFAITPLCALGIYAFCAFRLRRPLVGLVAGLLSLLSPIMWTFLVDWGFYANQAGTVLFMPMLIALDVVFEEWAAGNRGWRFRTSGLAVMALTALLGLVSPAIVAAPLLAIPAYGLAVRRGGWRRALRWLLVATPVLAGGALLLSAFWALPLQGYLAGIAARQPAPVYSPALFHLWSLGQVLQLAPMRSSIVQDRTSLSPAVWLPAVVGAVVAIWDGRIRAFLALIGFGILAMTAQLLYAVTFSLPFFPQLVTFRSGMLYLQFLVPVLAGLGLITLPQALGRVVATGVRLPPRLRPIVPAFLVLAGVALGGVGVMTFAQRIADNPNRLAYGAFPLDVHDIWQRHRDDVCGVGSTNPLCGSGAMTQAFSVVELLDACRDRYGMLRTGLPICAALHDPAAPRWTAQDDPLVGATLSWCQGRADPVCAARLSPLAGQVFDIFQWRPPATGCKLNLVGCQEGVAVQAGYRAVFSQPPQRTVLDAQSADLLKAFHLLTGGGQAGSYSTQLLSSPELDAFLQDGMLNRDGTALKAQLAEITGADGVVLATSQLARARDYQALGWKEVSNAPRVYAPPAPAAMAVQWPSGSRILVVGALQAASSHPYNDIFEWSSGGMLPADRAWLVRGRSAYVDDYSSDELSRYPVLLLNAYRYHDRDTAWARLDAYVRSGGRLYVESGWQYVDPDWDATSTAAALPIGQARWGSLNPSAPVLVQGIEDPGWGSMVYGQGGWGASSAGGVRPGAQPLVSVAGRVVVAHWDYGRGRVLWSGMNLMAHAYATGSLSEQSFLADQWRWLLPDPVPQAALQLNWRSSDAVDLTLQTATGPTDVLLKESIAAGWSASLRWPGGQKTVRIEPAEMDFMAVHLDQVPAGSTLSFTFGPTWGVKLSWLLSGLALAGLLSGVVKPALFGPFASAAARTAGGLRSRLRRRWRWDEED